MNPPGERPALPFELPPPAAGRAGVLIIAGEHSGDQHAARMARGFAALAPQFPLCALGGPALAASGVQVLHDLTGSSVVGLVEVLRHFSYFRMVFHATLRWIEAHRPRVVCLVDYPGFNLRLAAELKKRGLSRKGGGDICVVQYVSPQIWAWKAGRRFEMARLLDALAVIFPFETACYADTGLPVEFVGHPFADEGYQNPLACRAGAPVLLLPGSRRQPVARIFPRLLDGFAGLKGRHPEASARVVHPGGEILPLLEGELARRPDLAGSVSLEQDPERAEAGAVLTSSGTMSLNAALAGLPGAIAYRANPLTYWIGRRVVKIGRLGIANILLKRTMHPEYLQGAATGAALGGELEDALFNPARASQAAADARELHALLRHPAGRNAGAWLAAHAG